MLLEIACVIAVATGTLFFLSSTIEVLRTLVKSKDTVETITALGILTLLSAAWVIIFALIGW